MQQQRQGDRELAAGARAIAARLDGTVVKVAEDWNSKYYGKPVLPPDILVRGTAHNKGGDKLLADVSAVALGK